MVPATVVTPHFEIPDFGAGATIVSDSSGSWSDANTWSAGRVPTAEDVVAIAAGTTVSYDVASSPALDSVVIYAGGVLSFRTDISTQLLVTNLQVMEGGELRVGSAADPVAAAVTAQIVIRNVPLDAVSDPAQFGHGLIGLGKVTMHGAVQSHTFVRLAAELQAGQTTLSLAEAVTGWKAGDRLALPDTRHLKEGEIWTNYSPQWELGTIQAISADGLTITLAAPLTYDHIGARDAAGTLEFLPHVANLSRNVVVKSQSASGTRGHALFTHRADVDIRYTSFAGLGRTTQEATDDTTFGLGGAVTHLGTNQSGRYPVNFAHLYGPAGGRADGYQYAFVGNAVTCPLDPMPFRWGITINDSHYGLIRQNVLYNWAGAGLVMESGNESFNVVERNFVMATRGEDNPRDNTGLDGSAYWFKSFNNYVRDNVANASVGRHQGIVAGSGFNLFTPAAAANTRIPLSPGADLTQEGQYQLINMQLTPILEFARNETYGATATGLTLWHLGTDGYVARNIGQSVIRDFTAWHVHDEGFFGYPIQNVLFDGFVVRGHSRALNPFDGGVGWTSGDYWAGNVTLRHADIQGMYYAGFGGSINTPGTLTIEDSYFRNYAGNISIQTLATPGSGASKPPRITVIDNVQFDPMPGAPQFRTIEMKYYLGHGKTDVVQMDKVLVYNYNGTGQDFQLYYTQQHPAFLVPQTVVDIVTGSPVAGLTNQQNWNTYGIAIAGSVAPLTTTTLPEIVGLVRTFTVAPDTTPPSPPANLTTTVVSSSEVQLTWSAATDNVAVVGYRIYRSGQLIGKTSGIAYASTGLVSGATYSYFVTAYDAAGNVSSQSAATSGTTPMTRTIDDGTAGNSLVGSWRRITGRGYSNDMRVANKGNGSSYSRWTFSGLPSGQYQVWTTWKIGSGNATNAPYSVFDGSVSKLAVRVNQKVPPSGLSANGALWKLLGTVPITSGKLVVKLTNAANGKVVADAVRIQRLSMASPTPSIEPVLALENDVNFASASTLIQSGPVTLISQDGEGAARPVENFIASGSDFWSSLSADDLSPDEQSLTDAVELLNATKDLMLASTSLWVLATDEFSRELAAGAATPF